MTVLHLLCQGDKVLRQLSRFKDTRRDLILQSLKRLLERAHLQWRAVWLRFQRKCLRSDQFRCGRYEPGQQILVVKIRDMRTYLLQRRLGGSQ